MSDVTPKKLKSLVFLVTCLNHYFDKEDFLFGVVVAACFAGNFTPEEDFYI